MKVPRRILSVDWDYFFPDSGQFDWGHRESPLFFEALWPIRYGNRSIVGPDKGKRAADIMQPRQERIGFWRQFSLFPLTITVADSHKALLGFLEALRSPSDVEIVNYDAHHDAGYGGLAVDCGTWAMHALERGLLKYYTVVYPAWRKEVPENPPMAKRRVQVLFEKADRLVEPFSDVFICRSPAWTPPWADEQWLALLGWLRETYPPAWFTRNKLMSAPEPRRFDIEQAQRLEAKTLAIINSCSERTGK